MKYLCLNPRVLQSKEEMVRYLKEKLDFSPECGNNLDALHDELTTMFQPISMLLVTYERADGENAFPFCQGMYRMLVDSSRENGHLKVEVVSVPEA